MPPRFDKDEIWASFEVLKLVVRGKNKNLTATPKPVAGEAASVPLAQCKLLENPRHQLRIDERCAGYYMEGRIFTEAFKHCRTGYITCVEWGGGFCTTLAIYNCLDPLNATAADVNTALLPKGGLVRINEPYFFRVNEEIYQVRVDNPQNIFVTPPCPLVKPSREDGNAHFKQADYYAAKYCYEQQPVSDLRAASNLAQTEFLLGNFKKALALSQRVLLELNCDMALREKCLYRCGMACMELERFEQAAEYFSKQTSQDVKRLQLAHDCAKQQRTGEYDWDALFSSMGKTPPHLADYLGPIQVVSRPGALGRGLVTTRDVKRGELLLAEKPLFMRQRSDGKVSPTEFVCHICIRCMNDDGTLLRALYQLADGSQESTAAVAPPPPHTLSFRQGYDDEASLQQEPPVLDVNRILRIVALNSFGASLNEENETEGERLLLMRYLTSFCNHDCNATAYQVYLVRGNEVSAQGLRASRDMRAGEEVTIMYRHTENAVALAQRQAGLQSTWKFTCACATCVLEAQKPSKFASLWAEYAQISERFDNFNSSSGGSGQNLEELFKQCVNFTQNRLGAEPDLIKALFFNVFKFQCRLAERTHRVPLVLECYSRLNDLVERARFWNLEELCWESASQLFFARRFASEQVALEKLAYCKRIHQLHYGEMKRIETAIHESLDTM